MAHSNHSIAYVHGTNSAALNLMSRTDFCLISPIEMLRKHHLAPLTGEISNGGLRVHTDMCYPCFGIDSGNDRVSSNAYTLTKIVESYANQQSWVKVSAQQAKSDLINALAVSKKRNFTNINQLVIHFARFRQLGGDLNQLRAEIKEIQQGSEHSIQVLYFYLLLIKHTDTSLDAKNYMSSFGKVTIDGSGMDDLPPPKEVTMISIEELHHFIDKKQISFQTLFEKFDVEQWQAVLDELKPVAVGKECPLVAKKIFQYRENISKSSYIPDYALYTNHVGWAFEDLLHNIVSPWCQRSLFGSSVARSEITVKNLEAEVMAMQGLQDTFNEILNKNSAFFDISYDLTEGFPVVFYYDGDKMKEVDFSKKEYRATAPLKLGEDIKKVATNSVENQKKLKQFFMKHHLEIEVSVLKQADCHQPDNICLKEDSDSHTFDTNAAFVFQLLGKIASAAAFAVGVLGLVGVIVIPPIAAASFTITGAMGFVFFTQPKYKVENNDACFDSARAVRIQ